MASSNTETPEMSSSKPYLLRALHEWILDNGMTPHVVVDAHAEGVEAPPGADEHGKLVLNIAPRATRGLDMGNDFLSFEARFAGAARSVLVPIDAVLAIYARESGQGMVFAQDASVAGGEDEGSSSGNDDNGKGGGPNLRVIK